MKNYAKTYALIWTTCRGESHHRLEILLSGAQQHILLRKGWSPPPPWRRNWVLGLNCVQYLDDNNFSCLVDWQSKSVLLFPGIYTIIQIIILRIPNVGIPSDIAPLEDSKQLVAVTNFWTLKSTWGLVAVMLNFEEHLASRERTSRMKCSEERTVVYYLTPLTRRI